MASADRYLYSYCYREIIKNMTFKEINLTGKALEDFKRWYNINRDNFDELPISMQRGVIQRFADGVDIDFELNDFDSREQTKIEEIK